MPPRGDARPLSLERFRGASSYRAIVPGRRRRFIVDLLSRLWKFLAVFGAVWVFAAVGFYYFEGGISLFKSFYWAIVTLSTIGYGDIVPTNSAARAFTIVVAASQLFLLGYLISVITAVVAEETQRRLLGTLGTDLRGHVVVLGYTSFARVWMFATCSAFSATTATRWSSSRSSRTAALPTDVYPRTTTWPRRSVPRVPSSRRWVSSATTAVMTLIR